MSVSIGYVFDDQLASSFHHSLMGLVEWDRSKYDPHPEFDRSYLGRNALLGQRYGTDGLVQARNDVVARFLKTDSEWLFWLDTDMGFAPDVLDRLMALADKDSATIVGGLCFMQSHTSQDGAGGFRCHPQPTIFDWFDGFGQRFLRSRETYPVNALVECHGTGSACVVIHRSVFERIKSEHGSNWYTRVTNDSTGALVSEDLSFCIKAACPVFVYTGAKTTHLKSQWVGEPDFWAAHVAPPATEQVAVVVPVMRRPEAAARFMTSLRASTGLANAYAICDDADHDTQLAWKEAGAQVLISDRGYTFAEKANYGYERTTEPWLFLAGDDVKFWPGWYDQAVNVSVTENVAVVGTDDLGNTAVRAGEHATHPLIRRRYVDTAGASWDGPGVLCHEGYLHNYVDNEWTTVAKQRGQFGFAYGSIVEHLHPIWGRGDNDAVYVKGQRSMDADRKHWERRLKANR